MPIATRQAYRVRLVTLPIFVATGVDPAWDPIDGLGPHRRGVCEDYLARESGYALSRPKGPLSWCGTAI